MITWYSKVLLIPSLKNLSIVFLIALILNGALFNRIGWRMAEQSYIKVLISLVCNTHKNEGIKYSRRCTPTNVILPVAPLISAAVECCIDELNIILIPVLTKKIHKEGYVINLKDEFDKLIFKPPV